jgi:prepilin-type N-terminal cleavage/methylation domain-containing protein
MTNKKGFTLVEIAAAVAILLVILAIALPQFAKTQMVANEAAVLQAMRSVVMALRDYQANTRAGYPWALSLLLNTQPAYLDNRFVPITNRGGVWRGYLWGYARVPAAMNVATQAGNVTYTLPGAYTLRADPIRRGLTGQRSFFVDQTGVVRFNTRTIAGANDQPVEQAER